MNDVTLSVQRLASYREAIKKIKKGEYSLSFPKDTNIESILDFESELVQLAAWLDARLDGFNKIQEISTEISKGSVLDEVLNRIYDTFHEIIPYDRIGCALISDDYERVFAHWAKSNYPEKIMIKKGYSAFLSGSSLEGILTTQQPRILNDLQLYLVEHPNSLSTKLIVAEGIQSTKDYRRASWY